MRSRGTTSSQEGAHGRVSGRRPTTRCELIVANKRWAVLAVMSLSVFMVFVDGTVVNTALPAISRDLEATTAELQWVADGYILLLAGLLLVGGSIGDRYGRRRFLALGMVIFGVAAIGAALSTNVVSLVAFRGLQEWGRR